MNIRPFLAACFILITALPSPAQSYEYGKPGELKGLKKVFIDAGADVKERNNIVAVIEKAKLAGLEILDSADGAEVILSFSGGREQRASGQPSGVLFDPNNVRVGTGTVVIFGKDPKKLRLLLSVEGARDKVWKSNPSTKFAKEFISAYKSANGLK